MKFEVKKLLQVVVAGACVLSSAPAFAGHEGSGGGSATAADITRATETFISTVRQNPAAFPGVNPDVLENINPSIRVTGNKIKSCDGVGELDAYSDRAQNYSVFSFQAWTQKDEFSKVLLAGHERLVLAGLEASNTYRISDQLYKIRISDLESKVGPAVDICSLDGYACDEANKLEKLLGDIVQEYKDGSISAPEVEMSLQNQELCIDSLKDLVIGEKAVHLEREVFATNKEHKLDLYTQKVQLAFEARFRPMLTDAHNLIDSAEPAPSCVNLN